MIFDFRNRFDHLFPVFCNLIKILLGISSISKSAPSVSSLEQNCLLTDQINDAAKFIFRAKRNLNGNGDRLQPRPHHIHNTREIRAWTIHFINKSDAWHPILIRLPPNRFD